MHCKINIIEIVQLQLSEQLSVIVFMYFIVKNYFYCTLE
jgi:hypothetical protein